jgi:hypothetical protein
VFSGNIIYSTKALPLLPLWVPTDSASCLSGGFVRPWTPPTVPEKVRLKFHNDVIP